MSRNQLLEYGKIYHVYNRGINSCSIFYETTNYEHFLRLYSNHITPIAYTYAWVLMRNHFHFLVKIKEEKDVKAVVNLSGLKNLTGLQKPYQNFSNLFNAYTKAFNKRYERHGGLFERPFKRKLVSDSTYFNEIIEYIHNNPIHHGVVDKIEDYQWSSYIEPIRFPMDKNFQGNLLDTVSHWPG